MGKLILVPTPIGNIEDISNRSKQCISKAVKVLAEDTRVTGKLMKLLGLKVKLESFHMHNEHLKVNQVVKNIKNNDLDTVLVCDAGTPGISDPGYLLVRKCIQEEVLVEALPGPTALIPALVGSGFPSDRFIFDGFLPLKKGRKSRISEWKHEKRTIIFYESPHKLLKTLSQLVDFFGPDRVVSISRELSKIYEETFRGVLFEAIKYYTKKKIKGEFVICIAGYQNNNL